MIGPLGKICLLNLQTLLSSVSLWLTSSESWEWPLGVWRSLGCGGPQATGQEVVDYSTLISHTNML